jgi:hypothetical protein
MNLYRIFPVLWNDASNTDMQARTVYAADRAPPNGGFQTTCARRVGADPASAWDGATFQRLVAPPPSSGYVTWASLPSWLSYIQSIGYTITSDLSRLQAYSDIYVSGP